VPPAQPRVTMTNMMSATLLFQGPRMSAFRQRSRQARISLLQTRLLSDRGGPYMDYIFDVVSRKSPWRTEPVRRLRIDPRGPFLRRHPMAVDYGVRARQRLTDRRAADIHRVVIHQYGDTPIATQKLSRYARTWVHCSCPWFTFVCEYALAKAGSSLIVNCNGQPPRITNPRRLPVICKHIWAIFERWTGTRRLSRAHPGAVREVDYTEGIDLGHGRVIKPDAATRQRQREQRKQAEYTASATEGIKQFDERLRREELELLKRAAQFDEDLADLLG